MITKVHMEALSPTMEEGQLIRWLRSEGDVVAAGDVLAEIETDKATMELVARGDGVLRKILLPAGGTAPVGGVIGVIAGADEDISGVAGEAGGAPPAGGAPYPETTAAVQAGSGQATALAPVPPAAEGSGRVKASPLARRLADDLGVDLAQVEGSGPGGRIVKRDVETAKDRVAAPPPVNPARIFAAGTAPSEDEYVDVPLSQMRKTIARRLADSIGPVPHFFLTLGVDMGRVMEARERINSVLEKEGGKISINDIVLKAVATALSRHPECNAQWHGTHVRRYNAVHLGVAVAVADGLITPVVRNAHLKGIAHIAKEVRELAVRAKDKRLLPDEYTGATFSVSNLGMFGIQEFTAIINPPEAGILAVGAIQDTPVAVHGQIVVRPRMHVTMSCDHRVIDGAQGSRFLSTLREMLEEPAAMLV